MTTRIGLLEFASLLAALFISVSLDSVHSAPLDSLYSYQLLVSGSSVAVPPRVERADIWVIGAGGGGAGSPDLTDVSGGGGGAGGIAFRAFPVAPGDTLEFQIGSSGIAGFGAQNGGSGGETWVSVGTTKITAKGGSGGIYNDMQANAVGGESTGHSWSSPGGKGGSAGGNRGGGSGAGLAGKDGSWSGMSGSDGAVPGEFGDLSDVLAALGISISGPGAAGRAGSLGSPNVNHGGDASGFGCGGGSAGWFGGSGGKGGIGGGGGGAAGHLGAVHKGGDGGHGAIVIRWKSVPEIPIADIGCADGEREWFVDVEKHPEIAGCSGSWSRPGFRMGVHRPSSALGCARQGGDDGWNPNGDGCAVSDLCAEGWRVCETALDVSIRSGTRDCDEISQPISEEEVFFGTAQSTQGAEMCTGSGTNDVFGCGRSESGISSVSSDCGALNRRLTNLVDSAQLPWTASTQTHESLSVTKNGHKSGGVLCCREALCNCTSGTYCRIPNSGCADGTREFFKDSEQYPDIAGCQGGFSQPGLRNLRQCVPGSSGNDGTNKNGEGCAAADLCEPGWEICGSQQEMLMNTHAKFCDSSRQSLLSPDIFYASAATVGSAKCELDLHGEDGFFGCGNVNPGSYCMVAGVASFDAFSGSNNCSGLGDSWSCSGSGNSVDTVAKMSEANGGVLCCRKKAVVCESCPSGLCPSNFGKPEIISIHPLSSSTLPGGILITLTGFYFGSSGDVFIGENKCIFGENSVYFDSLVVCEIPIGVGANLDVSLHSRSFNQIAHVEDVFHYDPPSLDSIFVGGQSSTAGGYRVTLTGLNFGRSASQVSILHGSIPCNPIPSTLNHSSLEYIAPAGIDSLSISVIVAEQSSTNSLQFTYDAPFIDELVGSIAATEGSSLLTILGGNFGINPGTVKIAADKYCDHTFWSHSEIICVVPSGEGRDHEVKVDVGLRSASSPFRFSYAAPKILMVSPSVVSSNSIFEITIMGSSFGQSKPNVKIGSALIDSSLLTLWNDTYIRLKIPLSFSGNRDQISIELAGEPSSVCDAQDCTLSIADPIILSTSGCINDGVSTKDCGLDGQQTITIVGYNFGTESSTRVFVGGIPCPISEISTNTVSPSESLYQIICTLPAYPSGGINIPIKVVVGDKFDSKELVSFVRPFILPNSLHLCPSLTTTDHLKGVSFEGYERVCFSVQNLGNSPVSILVQYGVTKLSKFSDGVWYNCTNVTLDSSKISCFTSPGVGENLQFRVKTGVQWSPLGSDKLSYGAITLTSNSIRRNLSFSGSANYVSRSQNGDWVVFGVNLPFSSYSHLWKYISVYFGPRGEIKTNECRQVSILEQNAEYILRCRMPIAAGSNLSFQVFGLNSKSSESDFSFSYPAVPLISSVVSDFGCKNNGIAIEECDSRGGQVLNVSGSGFCDFRNNPCKVEVFVGTRNCLDVEFISSNLLKCRLPEMNGQDLTLQYSASYLDGDVSVSVPQVLVSFASPSIFSVSGCRDLGNNTLDCPRTHFTQLTILGDNFGRSGASVFLGSVPCINVTHDSDISFSRLTCMAPPGKDEYSAVVVLQSSGTPSFTPSHISYESCLPGTFESEHGIECEVCPAGSFSSTFGARKCSVCDPGYYSENPMATACSACAPGRYSEVKESTSCDVCVAGKFSLDASSSCSSCTPGKYQPIPGQFFCHSCDPGKYSTNQASTECLICPMGTFSTRLESVFCTLCPSGHYSSIPGSTNCSICPKGTIPSSSGDLGFGASFCQPCPKGTYNEIEGGDVCIPCSSGTFTSNPGQESCIECPSGTFAEAEGSDSCKACPPGTEAEGEGNVMCSVCRAGYFAPQSSTEKCQECPAGYYQAESGRTSCIPCGLGMANAQTGQPACLECGPGFVSNLSASTTCHICPIGTYSYIDFRSSTTECISCDPGKYSPRDASGECLKCPLGSFTNVFGATTCNPCGLGEFGNNSGLTECFDCRVGEYSDTLGSSKCPLCPSGSYQDQEGQSFCSFCSVGKYQGAEGFSFCDLCSVGSFASVNGSQVCEKCEPGTYSIFTGGTQCLKCSGGKFQSDIGQSRCFNCAQGKISFGGAASCELCGPRLYAPTNGLSTCLACPDHSTSEIDRVSCICEIGFYGTGNSSSSAFNCKACPVGANCTYPGVTWDTMQTAVGYWRSGIDSAEFYECQFSSFCTGGRESGCGANRKGTLCALCEDNYEAFGFDCKSCGKKSQSIAFFAVSAVLMIGLLTLVYYSLLKLDKQQLHRLKDEMRHQDGTNYLGENTVYLRNQEGALSIHGPPAKPPNFVYKLKILLGFFQIIVGIAFGIEIPWPDFFKQFIANFNVANFDIIQLTRAGCVVGITFLQKHLIITLLPLAIFVGVLLFYVLPKLIKFLLRKDDNRILERRLQLYSFIRGLSKSVKMILFTLFLIYPTLSSIVLRLYNCRVADGISYLAADFRIRCDSPEWIFRAKLNILFVFLYPVGILALFALIMYRYKSKLNDPQTMVMFGFMYGPYLKNFWWFELLDMTHKLYLTSIVQFFPTRLKVPFAMVGLTLHTISLLVFQPYMRKGDDRLHLFVQALLLMFLLAGYVTKENIKGDIIMDTLMTVFFIFTTFVLVLYVIVQIVQALYKAHKEKNKKNKANFGNTIFEQAKILKANQGENVSYGKNPYWNPHGAVQGSSENPGLIIFEKQQVLKEALKPVAGTEDGAVLNKTDSVELEREETPAAVRTKFRPFRSSVIGNIE